jgi:hypothetical protein
MFFLQNAIICKHELHVLVEKRKLEGGESMKDEKKWRGKQTEEDGSKQKRKQTRG